MHLWYQYTSHDSRRGKWGTAFPYDTFLVKPYLNKEVKTCPKDVCDWLSSFTLLLCFCLPGQSCKTIKKKKKEWLKKTIETNKQGFFCWLGITGLFKDDKQICVILSSAEVNVWLSLAMEISNHTNILIYSYRQSSFCSAFPRIHVLNFPNILIKTK